MSTSAIWMRARSIASRISMAFLDFLDYVIDEEDVTDFFIVGCILDVWRRDAVGVAIENNDALDMLKEVSLRTKVHHMAENHDCRTCGLTNYKYPLGISERQGPKVGATFQPYKNHPRDGHLATRYRFKQDYDFEAAMLLCEPLFNLLCRINDESGGSGSRLYDILANVIGQLNKRCPKADDIGIYAEKSGRGLSDDIFGRFSKYLASLLSLYKSSTHTASALPDKSFLTSEPEKRLSNKRDTFSIKRDPAPEKGYRAALIFGHTHMPFHYIDGEDHSDVISLGSWVKTCKPYHNTCPETKDGVEAMERHHSWEVIPTTEDMPGSFVCWPTTPS
jgi:UDP-2,3-diacylglucosamine pyrophosphatase LpxH